MNRNTTIVLLVVLAVLALYVFLVQVPKDQAAASATPTEGGLSTYLWSFQPEQVNGLRVVDRATGRSLALAKDAQGQWAITEPEPQPADAATLTSVIQGLTSLYVSTSLTGTTDLSAFGVLSPTHTLEVDLVDGSRLNAAIGDKDPTGSGYYVLREGATDVQVVSTYGLDDVIGLLDKPPVLSTPTVAVTGTVTVPLTGTALAGTPMPETAVPPATSTLAATATP